MAIKHGIEFSITEQGSIKTGNVQGSSVWSVNVKKLPLDLKYGNITCLRTWLESSCDCLERVFCEVDINEQIPLKPQRYLFLTTSDVTPLKDYQLSWKVLGLEDDKED